MFLRWKQDGVRQRSNKRVKPLHTIRVLLVETPNVDLVRAELC